MPGKVLKLIKKHTTTHHHQAAAGAAAAPPNPYSLLNILLRYDHEKKMWLAIGPAQRAAEKAAKELELLKAKEQEAAAVLVKGFKEAAKDQHHHQAPAVTNDQSSSDYSSFESKLDATKRKLHDSYQQLANAKKQRKIQVIDPRDLPPTQPSSSRGAARSKATVVAARKKMMITTNKKTMNNSNLFDGRGGGGGSKLMKPPTSIS